MGLLGNQLNENDNISDSRVFDYFIVCGLPPPILNTPNLPSDQHDQLLYQSIEDSNNPHRQKLEPIVDIVVINRAQDEIVPHGFECIWTTTGQNSANLTPGVFSTTSEFFLCYRRGLDKPPISDIGILYDNGREKVLEGCTVLSKTVEGRSANLNQSSQFNSDRIYVTYRRAAEFACNSLAVIDICVVAKSKGETPPHSFNEIKRDLNKSLIGASIRICYRKAWIPAPQIKYTPTVLYRYPSVDHANVPFPGEVASFGLPMGASIESWPARLALPQPVISTFVLNVNSEDGMIMEKVYGTSLTFYELFDESKLSNDQRDYLSEMCKKSSCLDKETRELRTCKCLILLSRWPLFDTFKRFLLFLHERYTKIVADRTSQSVLVPIERYLHYMIYEVPFPTQHKPTVHVYLTDERDEDCLSINLPYECILPQSGAQFTELISNLGVENSINVFLFVLLQKSVMFHSLRKQVLTSVVEAISCIIFPFIWRYSYIPMCPLSLSTLIEAPGSFILGMDTRFFDLFETPQNVICVDLDTNSISWTPERASVNIKILPKKPVSVLKARLAQLETETKQLNELRSKMKQSAGGVSAETEAKLKNKERYLDLAIREAFLRFMVTILQNYKNFLRTVTRRPDLRAIDRNLSIFFDCDGFLRSKDTSSQFFFSELIKTQLFYDCIMNLSFTSELDPILADSFAFFADICSRMSPQSVNGAIASSPTSPKDEDVRLLEYIEHSNTQTMVIMPPSFDERFLTKYGLNQNEMNNELIASISAFVYSDETSSSSASSSSSSSSSTVMSSLSFPKLKIELSSTSYLAQSSRSNANSTTDLNSSFNSQSVATVDNGNLDTPHPRKNSFTGNLSNADTQSISSGNQVVVMRRLKQLETPVSVRTKAEKYQSHKKIVSKLNVRLSNNMKNNEKTKYNVAKQHAFLFLSNAYALWFMCLPSYIRDCESASSRKNGLNYAYQVLIQMQNHNLTSPDEICFRIIMKLCELYKMPTLAVRTFFHMRKYHVDITPITYSYYNKSLIDSSGWPSFEKDRWAKLRLICLVAFKFKQNLVIKKQREDALRRKKKKVSGKKKSNTLKSKKVNVKKTVMIVDDTAASKSTTNTIEAVEESRPKIPEIITTDSSTINREEIKSILLSRQRSLGHTSQLIKQDNGDLHFKHAGILTIPQNKLDKTGGQKSKKQSQLEVIKNLNISSSSLNSARSTSIKTVEGKETVNGGVVNDPLGASKLLNATTPTSVKQARILNSGDDVKRRLFDYKPFETTSDSSVSRKVNSDFIFPHKEVVNDSDAYSESEDEEEELEDEDEFDEDDQSEDQDDGDLYDSDEYGSYDDEDYDSDEVEVDSTHFTKKTSNHQGSKSGQSQPRASSIDIENIMIDTSSLQVRKESQTSKLAAQPTPSTSSFSSPFSSRFFSMVNKSIETSTSKLKNISSIIAEKSVEIKDVLSNQPELKAKIKSFSSNYQINTTPYWNGFIKSPTSLSSLSSSAATTSNTNTSASTASKLTKNKPPLTSQHSRNIDSLLETNVAFQSKLDLDQLPAEETGYRPLTFDWWDVKRDVSGDDQVLVDVQISSCNYCDSCKSFLYDEDIMSAWTLKESDLNINCLYCNKSIVPKLFIRIQDLQRINNHIDKEEESKKEEEKPECEHPFQEKSSTDSQNENNTELKVINVTEFTVGYFSPLVVRKELENIILNHNSDIILSNNSDTDNIELLKNHNIIFWNLIWYFKRIGVDNSHLVINLLNSRIEALTSGEKKKTIKFQPSGVLQSIKPFGQHSQVRIKCMWDNLKLQSEKVAHDVPLYLCWLNTNYDLVARRNLKGRLTTALTESELKQIRKSTVSSRTLAKLYELIIRNIKETNMTDPFRNVLRERVKSKMNMPSVYREILFLVDVALERDMIDVDAFDNAYRESYELLAYHEGKELIKPSDKPPNNIAVWCRRLFSPLLI